MISLFGSTVFQVFVTALVVGAGVPALFSLGIRALAWGPGNTASGDTGSGAAHDDGAVHPLGRVLGIACFVLVVAIVAMGVAVVVSSGLGMKVSFEHLVPTFTPQG